MAASTLSPFDFYEFRNQHYSLPVVRVSIDLPVYRMQNFRTFTDQTEYIAKEKTKSDFFSTGQELESVQQVQHEMLAKLAERGVSDSVAPISEVLKRDKQREPLLITASGVVVNGNRRLAAMRELYSEDKSAFAEFSYVNCAVLPADATTIDILDIEAGLQAKQETKLAYDWVGDAQLMSAMVTSHGDIAAVSEKLSRSEREIRNTIQALAEADLYLKEWANAPGEYSRVRDEAEQLFKDLPKRLDDKEVPLQEASRVIAWTLFENRENLGSRLYDYNAAFGKLAADVMDRVGEKLGISTPTLSENEEDSDFPVNFGEGGESTSYRVIIEQLREPDTKSEVADALIEAAQNAIEADRGQKSGQASLRAVSQAHAKLMAVDVSRAAPDTHAPMLRQLESIEQLAKLLIKRLSSYKKS